MWYKSITLQVSQLQGRGPPSGSFYEMVKKQYLVLSVGGAQTFCVFLFRFFLIGLLPFAFPPIFFLGLLGKFNDFFMLLDHAHFFLSSYFGSPEYSPFREYRPNRSDTSPKKVPWPIFTKKNIKGGPQIIGREGNAKWSQRNATQKNPPPKYIHRTKYGFLHFRGSSVLKEKFTVCAALPCAGRRYLFLCCTIASCVYRRGEVFLCLEKWSVWGTTAQKGGCTPTCLSRRCLSCCLSAPQNGFICSTSSGLLHKTMKFNAVPHLMSAGFRGTEAPPDSDQAVF